jgi:hypothetical protein
MQLRPLPRIYRLPPGSFFLFGLRGVGKSTWIGEQLPDAHRFDLLGSSARKLRAAGVNLLGGRAPSPRISA